MQRGDQISKCDATTQHKFKICRRRKDGDEDTGEHTVEVGGGGCGKT